MKKRKIFIAIDTSKVKQANKIIGEKIKSPIDENTKSKILFIFDKIQ